MKQAAAPGGGGMTSQPSHPHPRYAPEKVFDVLTSSVGVRPLLKPAAAMSALLYPGKLML